MPREILETTINGHRYETVPLVFDDALTLKADLLRVLADPMAKAFGSLSSDVLDAEVDLGKLGAEVAQIPAAVTAAGGAALFARILHDTTRIADGGTGQLVRQPLRDPQMRTAAFSGGNWEEFYRCVGWVIWVNYGPFLTVLKESFKKLSPLLSGLQSGMPSAV